MRAYPERKYYYLHNKFDEKNPIKIIEVYFNLGKTNLAISRDEFLGFFLSIHDLNILMKEKNFENTSSLLDTENHTIEEFIEKFFEKNKNIKAINVELVEGNNIKLNNKYFGVKERFESEIIALKKWLAFKANHSNENKANISKILIKDWNYDEKYNFLIDYILTFKGQYNRIGTINKNEIELVFEKEIDTILIDKKIIKFLSSESKTILRRHGLFRNELSKIQENYNYKPRSLDNYNDQLDMDQQDIEFWEQ